MSRAMSFTDHRRELADNRYVYAVVSRRARGLSIGVNLNPDKTCNFDCPYCQVDRTTPGGPRTIDPERLQTELDHLFALTAGDLWTIPPFDTTAPALRRVVDVAFAGDGEPTSPPEFPIAAGLARERMVAHGLAVPLRLLTNATLLHRERVRAALPAFDQLWCKLDAGTEAYFQRVDGTRLPFQRILTNLAETARTRPIVIQAMFLRLDGEPPSALERDAWAARLADIAAAGTIEGVQVYTVSRRPASPTVAALELPELEDIAERVRGLGIPVEVFA